MMIINLYMKGQNNKMKKWKNSKRNKIDMTFLLELIENQNKFFNNQIERKGITLQFLALDTKISKKL